MDKPAQPKPQSIKVKKQDFKYEVGLKIFDKMSQSQEKKVLVVKKKGNDQYVLPSMEIEMEVEQKEGLNKAKMNLFQKLSNNQWKVFYGGLEPNYVEVEKNSDENNKIKRLFFEATKFDKNEPIVNSSLYEDFKWVPMSSI